MPGATRLKEGHLAEIEFAEFPNIKLFATTIKPAKISGGGGISQTNLSNQTVHTQWPKTLDNIDNITFTAQYAPDVYVDILGQRKVNQLFKMYNPDSTYVQVWGWLDEFDPQEFKTGEDPVANCVFCVSNLNDSDEETPPTYHTS